MGLIVVLLRSWFWSSACELVVWVVLCRVGWPGARMRECQENAGERRLIPLFGPDAKVTCKKETLKSAMTTTRADETLPLLTFFYHKKIESQQVTKNEESKQPSFFTTSFFALT